MRFPALHAATITAALALSGAALRAQAAAPPAAAAPFDVVEASVADVEAALHSGAVTCHVLVQDYLDRIDAYDKNGPAINAIIIVNPDALAVADSLDGVARRGGKTGPLHCIPVIVKDNYQTKGLQTTGGSLAFKGFKPDRDAFVVARLRAAGAIVLAKSNMAELAFSPYETVSSILPGYTHNPYELDRVTAGSSGGTAAAVAASFGDVGLGTDTGNSIRGPSSHQALVGIRPTMGLTSRAGVVPLFLGADVTGPMARTVADAVAVLQVIAGPDPEDPVTLASRGHVSADYASALVRDGLRGARIGVLHQAYDTPTMDPEIRTLFQTALDDMRRQGATIIDPVAVPGLDEIRRLQKGGCNTFKRDFNAYLATLGPAAPVKSLAELIRSRKYHPSIEVRLKDAEAVEDTSSRTEGCTSGEAMRAALRTAVTQLMDSMHLDAMVYPTWSNPPRLIGDLNTPAGDNNQFFSPYTGFPAITVPMGFTHGGVLPDGVQFFGRAWDERTLIRLAYSYEQATRHRRPPVTTPPLVAVGR
ncbi:MAG TPA: amidase family protein [Gemmatimonadaceae bacterium]|nr:amidase family protein [Gemmatimonadaceae bacterium]